MTHTLKTGCLAYFDSFGGLVPGKVVRIFRANLTNSLRVVFESTTNHGPIWHKGDRIEVNANTVVPRTAIRRKQGRFFILPYRVEENN